MFTIITLFSSFTLFLFSGPPAFDTLWLFRKKLTEIVGYGGFLFTAATIPPYRIVINI